MNDTIKLEDSYDFEETVDFDAQDEVDGEKDNNPNNFVEKYKANGEKKEVGDLWRDALACISRNDNESAYRKVIESGN